MRIRNLFSLALAMMVAPLTAAEWITDFKAAQEKAAKEGKAILVDFTGSDWCGSCIQLRKKVLDTPAFGEYADGKFVFMEVDMPRSVKQEPALAAQNRGLCARYDARMFPTILVLSPEGDVLGGFIGARPSVEAAAAPLDAALANLPKIREARATQGIDRARKLMEVYTSLPIELKSAAGACRVEIEAHDPDNLTGIRTPKLQTHEEFIHNVNAAGADVAKVIRLIDARLACVDEEERPELLRLKGMAMIVSAWDEGDLMRAKEVLTQAATMMGGGRKANLLREFIAREFSDPAALLTRVKTRQAEEKRAALATEAQSYLAKLEESGTTPEQALADLEKDMATTPPARKAEMLRLKGALLQHSAKSADDLAAAKAAFQQAADLMGDTSEAHALRTYIEQTFPAPKTAGQEGS